MIGPPAGCADSEYRDVLECVVDALLMIEEENDYIDELLIGIIRILRLAEC